MALALQDILKIYYPPDRVRRIAYTNNPFLAMVPKDEAAGGKTIQVDVQFGNPQGRSVNFANAQANASNSLYGAFVLSRVSDYSVMTIGNETIKASRGRDNAFLDALQTEMNNMLYSLRRSVATALFRNGSGSIGKVSNANPTTTITLATPQDHVNFEPNMILTFSTADGGGTVKAGTTKVTKINRETGVLTVSPSVAVAPFTTAVAANDFIFQQGDYGGKLLGLDAWIPTTAPGATLFNGVDRSQDTDRLGGVRISGQGAPIEETLIEAMGTMGEFGASPDKFFMNYKEWKALAKTLEGRVQIVNVRVAHGGQELIGFRAMRTQGPSGEVDIVPTANCPAGRGYLLQMDSWKLFSLGPVPHIFDTDGNENLRQSNADGVEVRSQYYAQLGCNAPGYNAVVTF